MPTTVTIKDVTQSGDWFKISADPIGDLSTKKRDLAVVARELKGQTASIEFTERINEKDGRTYTNRYLDKIEPAASAAPFVTKDEMIHRQTASKVAAAMLPYLDEAERTPHGLIDLCEFWVRYYQGGPDAVVEDMPPTDDIPF